MICAMIVQMFWLLNSQSDTTTSQIGWGIISIIIAGIFVCWVCIVVKKVIFLFCEEKAKPNLEHSPKRKKEGKHEDSRTTKAVSTTTKKHDQQNKKEEVEENENDDIDEDLLDQEEILQIEPNKENVIQEKNKIEAKELPNDKTKKEEKGPETNITRILTADKNEEVD